jgi:glycerol kinase
LATQPAHIARATLEAIALQIGDVVAALDADFGTAIAELSIDGGAARNALLMQLLADLTDRRIVRSTIPEASALGVARLAADGLGMTLPASGEEQKEFFDPAMSAAQRERLLARWHAAVAGAVRAAGSSET